MPWESRRGADPESRSFLLRAIRAQRAFWLLPKANDPLWVHSSTGEQQETKLDALLRWATPQRLEWVQAPEVNSERALAELKAFFHDHSSSAPSPTWHQQACYSRQLITDSKLVTEASPRLWAMIEAQSPSRRHWKKQQAELMGSFVSLSSEHANDQPQLEDGMQAHSGYPSPLQMYKYHWLS